MDTSLAQVVVKPSSAEFYINRTYTIEVWVEDVSDLYGADVQLAFDPAWFEVIDANPSLPGVQVNLRSEFLSPGAVAKNTVDNQLGTIWYAATQLNPAQPVSGSGVLFDFELRGLQAGSAGIDVNANTLSNRNGEQIPSSSSGATYQLHLVEGVYLPVILSYVPTP